jgi:hypothetical protein
MSVATLKGTFDSFPLPDVLRLVAASDETGLLRVDSSKLSGRIFIVDGDIAYATTRSGDDLIDDLARLDQITSEERDAIERRAVQLEDVRASRRAVLDVFFGHQVTEVLVRLLALTEGGFSFDHGVMMSYQVGFRFGVEDALDAAAVRGVEWEEIHRRIPGVDSPFRMVDTIEREVTVDPNRWALLAMLSRAHTARELALMLKVFEFDAAKRLADLAEEGMIVEATEPALTSAAVPAAEAEMTSERPSASEATSEEAPESQMTDEEAAELLGSFIALSEDARDHNAEQPAEPTSQETGGEEEDLPNRWRRLRHRSEGD